MQNENSEKEIDLIELINVVWKQRKDIIKWGVIGGVIGIIIAFSIPKEYTSTARVAPEEQQKMGSSMGMLASMMGSRPSTDFAAINSAVYQDILISTPFVMEFANIMVEVEEEKMPLHEYLLKNQSKPWWSYIFAIPGKVIGLFSSSNEQTFDESIRQQQIFVGTFNKSIMIEQDDDTRIFTLSSTFQDPTVAQMVLDTMLVKLQDYMNGYHTAKTKETIKTNTVMLDEAKQKYYNAEEAYAKAIDNNHNLISKAANLKLDRLANEKSLAFQIYQQIALQVESDKLKLQDQKQIATVIEPTSTPTIPSAPRKFIIIVAFGMLAGFAIVAKIVFNYIK